MGVQVPMPDEYDRLVDLEDEIIRELIENEGLEVGLNQNVRLAIETNGSTGAYWQLKPGVCADQLTITEGTVEPDGFEFMDENGEMLQIPAGPGTPWTKQYNLQGIDVGSCKFMAAYGTSWEFDWDTAPEGYWDKLEFTVRILSEPTL